jgi:hypothetical protein
MARALRHRGGPAGPFRCWVAKNWLNTVGGSKTLRILTDPSVKLRLLQGPN